MNKMKKLALKVPSQFWTRLLPALSGVEPLNMGVDDVKVIAENMSEEDIKGLKQMFNNMDTDRSGTITFEELKMGLSRLGSKLTEAEMKQLMDAVRSRDSLFPCSRLSRLHTRSLVYFLIERHLVEHNLERGN